MSAPHIYGFSSLHGSSLTICYRRIEETVMYIRSGVLGSVRDADLRAAALRE